MGDAGYPETSLILFLVPMGANYPALPNGFGVREQIVIPPYMSKPNFFTLAQPAIQPASPAQPA